MPFSIRKATIDDRGELESLIARSARALTLGAYTPRQVETALRGAFGVDSQLISDGTYLVAEAEGSIVGCGGWSRRHTLFGGDARAHRDSAELNPARDAAKIRAFFIDPAHVREGIGTALLERCEAEARGCDGHAVRRRFLPRAGLRARRCGALRARAGSDHRVPADEQSRLESGCKPPRAAMELDRAGRSIHRMAVSRRSGTIHFSGN